MHNTRLPPVMPEVARKNHYMVSFLYRRLNHSRHCCFKEGKSCFNTYLLELLQGRNNIFIRFSMENNHVRPESNERCKVFTWSCHHCMDVCHPFLRPPYLSCTERQ